VTAFIARRLLLTVPLLLVVTFVSFVAVDLMPGDYVTRLEARPDLSQETVERYREQFGLDRTVWVRYTLWLSNIVTRGDFGTSFQTSLPVFDTLFLGGRLGRTLLVSGTTLLFMWAVAVPLGVAVASRQHGWIDQAVAMGAFATLSIPGFVLGVVLLWLLAGPLHAGSIGLGVGGLMDRVYVGEPLSWGKLGNLLWHLWPIWIAAGLSGAAGLLRYARGSLLDELQQQYVLAARARGLSEHRVLYGHALRNALLPLISILGMQLPRLVGGSLIVSIVFGLQTVEGAFWLAIQRQDTYVILGGLLFFGGLLALGNLLADVLLAWADPRVHLE